MVQREGIRPPAIFIVGDVVKLRDQLRWFDRPDIRPLFGKRILVTRARAQASALTEKLKRARGLLYRNSGHPHRPAVGQLCSNGCSD